MKQDIPEAVLLTKGFQCYKPSFAVLAVKVVKLEKVGFKNVTHVTQLEASSTNPGVDTRNQFLPHIKS